MASKNEEAKKTSTKKTSTTKKSTTTKTSTKKSATAKSNTSKKTSTTKTTPKKTTKSVRKTTTTKKSTPKKVEKELEKTVLIEDIENKINEIVENKKEEVKEENVAKIENAKYTIRKRNKHLLAIGVVISLLGIIALIITLIANRMVDKEFISDSAIAMMVIASILIEIFGAFIIINES